MALKRACPGFHILDGNLRWRYLKALFSTRKMKPIDRIRQSECKFVLCVPRMVAGCSWDSGLQV